MVAIYALVEVCAFGLLRWHGKGEERSATLASLTSRLSTRQREVVRAALEETGSRVSIHDELGWVAPMRSPASLPEGGRIIAAFGDSFTYGDEVEAHEAWPFLLDEALPDATVLNLGVPAYGLDQALLRYRLESRRLEPEIVLIGFILDDAARNTTPYRPFIFAKTTVPLSKPRFVLEGDELKLLPNPLRRGDYREMLAAGCTREKAAESATCADALPLALRLPSVQLLSLLGDRTGLVHVAPGEAVRKFDLAARLFLEFQREARRNGAEPIVVLLPTRNDLRRASFEQYESYFNRHGIRFIDVGAALRRVADVDSLFRPGGHYSPRANRIVAGAVRQYLESDPSSGFAPSPSGSQWSGGDS